MEAPHDLRDAGMQLLALAAAKYRKDLDNAAAILKNAVECSRRHGVTGEDVRQELQRHGLELPDVLAALDGAA